jgi:hypothetical protein
VENRDKVAHRFTAVIAAGKGDSVFSRLCVLLRGVALPDWPATQRLRGNAAAELREEYEFDDNRVLWFVVSGLDLSDYCERLPTCKLTVVFLRSSVTDRSFWSRPVP